MSSKAICLIARAAARMKTGWLIRCMAFASISVAMGLHILSNAAPTPQQREALLAPIPPSPAMGWFMWWEPDDSRLETNMALEKTHGWKTGGAVCAMERILKDELEKTGGGDSNTVTRALDAIRQSGDASVTNTLDSLLFSDTAAFCPGLFNTRAAFCGLDQWEFARRIVKDMPEKKRHSCYVAAVPLINVKWEDTLPRHVWQVFMLLQSCAAEETSAPLAELLDTALSKDTLWNGRNIRKHMAMRFEDASGKPGLYFRKLTKKIGSPAFQPDREAMMQNLLEFGVDEPSPKNYPSLLQKCLNTMFAQDYMITETDVIRLIEREFMKRLETRDKSAEASFFRGYALSAISRRNDPASTNMLLDAILKAEWNPERIATFSAYAGFVGLDALPVAREVLTRQDIIMPGGHILFHKAVAELAQGDGATENTIKTVSAFLKEFLSFDRNNSLSLDVSLAKADPDWISSKERKDLATQEIAHLANMEKNPILLDKAFSEIDPDWATSEERKTLMARNNNPQATEEERLAALNSEIIWRGADYWASFNEDKANLVRREITRRANTYTLQYFTTVLEKIEKTEEQK